MRILGLTVAAVACMLAASSALGMVMDTVGNVTDWGVTPFSRTNRTDAVTAPGTWSTIQNDYAPLNYPGLGYVPSPGGTTGEKFDLEEMHVNIADNFVRVLLVTSSAWGGTTSNGTWRLGDLFFTVDGQRYGVVTQTANEGLTQGAVYRIDGSAHVAALQSGSASYLGNTTLVANDYGPDATVASVTGPWAVISGTLLGQATISTATFNYGGAEDGTFLMEYLVPKDLLNLDVESTLTTKIAYGCGNDVIRVNNPITAVPEPGTLVLLAGGALMTYFASRKRDKK